MPTTGMRQRLINYVQVAEAKKTKAMYILFKDDIQFSDDQKAELDSRMKKFKRASKTVSSVEMTDRLKKVMAHQ